MSQDAEFDLDLDETDIEILRRVEENSDVNLEELSNELDLSKSAIHYRLNKLKDADVITATSADVDPLALGLNMMMLTEVTVSHDTGYAEEIGESLTEVDGVCQAYYTMGDIDFVVISRVQDRDQMNGIIDAIIGIDGVNATSSRFVMKELKTGSETVANMSDEMIQNVVSE